jgi:UPF0271 protein
MAKSIRKHRVDLNADVGELEDGCDEALMALVTSVNIACGWHAGSASMMQRNVRWALQNGVAIGAHPSFDDRDNFGRTEIDIAPQEIHAAMLYQIGALAAIAGAQGARLSHVKPHGALYNMAARDAALSEAIVAAVRDIDPALAVVGLASSETVRAAQRAGLVALEEVFADRGYENDGSLVRRGTPGALIEDEDMAVEQVLAMVREGRVKAADGSWVALRADTVCLHGDGAHALAFATLIRGRLEAEDIDVLAFRAGPGRDAGGQSDRQRYSVFPLLD